MKPQPRPRTERQQSTRWLAAIAATVAAEYFTGWAHYPLVVVAAVFWIFEGMDIRRSNCMGGRKCR